MRPKGTAEQLETRRRIAVNMLENGFTVQETAENVRASERSVRRWRKANDDQGPEGLSAQKAPGPTPRLSEKQRRQLAEILDRGAKASGFATDLWTCGRVTKVIRNQFAVDYHSGHVSRIMHDIGFTRQKPERRAKERNDATAQQWRERDWPRIKRGPFWAS